jgi:hypothetical protein
MMLRLDPGLPLILAATGEHVRAFVLIDRGDESHLLWVCVRQSGEIWCYENPAVRMDGNPTLGRPTPNLPI